jgi:hypothetical protein
MKLPTAEVPAALPLERATPAGWPSQIRAIGLGLRSAACGPWTWRRNSDRKFRCGQLAVAGATP